MSTNHPRPARMPSPPPRSPSPVPRVLPRTTLVSHCFTARATSSRPCPYSIQVSALEVQGPVRSTQSSPLVQRAALAVPAVAFLTEVKSESDADDDVCPLLHFIFFKWLIGVGRRIRPSRRLRTFSGRSQSRRSPLSPQLVSHAMLRAKRMGWVLNHATGPYSAQDVPEGSWRSPTLSDRSADYARYVVHSNFRNIS